MLIFILSIALLAFCSSCTTHAKEQDQQKSFEWVFGDLVKLDTAIVRKVLANEPGKRHYVDYDGDGKPEEVWFIDISPRHTEKKSPLLVRVIDRDGDLVMGGEPDLDSDLYIADWNADGTVDAVVGYEDTDGDQDVDRMGIYFFDQDHGLRVWWSRDDGDDNRLWYDVDYTYYQELCEQRTHFGGDESFVSFYIRPGDRQWTPFFENPFFFFDRDGDGVTEEVIRLVGEGNNIHSMRWSFDADNNATPESPRDYDVSISATAGKWDTDLDKEHGNDSSLTYDDSLTETVTIQGFPAKMIKRGLTASFLQTQTWSRVLMTWDENDLNTAYRVPGNTHERWEGVIASASGEPGFEMARIGWPDCGPVNKRYEIILQPEGPNEYYYHPADQRIHMKGSDKAWLKVDFDYDTQVDMTYEWADTDKDGLFDLISVDMDGDGRPDDSWAIDTSGIKSLKWEFGDLNAAHSPVVSQEPSRLYCLNRILAVALESKEKGAGNDAVWDMTENRMQCKELSEDLSQRLILSDESLLYYLRISADRRIVHLKKLYPEEAYWNTFDLARSQGNTSLMSELIAKEFNKPQPAASGYNTWISGLRKQPERKCVAWDNKWLVPNWGWESEKAAFRCYDGHFDLFGKRVDTLIYPTISSANSYHIDEGSWGMDILHVGPTGGCGGLVLYVDGVAYPVRNEKGLDDPVFTARLLKETDDIVTIGFTVTGVGPKDAPYTVLINASARAGQNDSQLEVRVEGGKASRNVLLGIVLNRLPIEQFFIDKASGIMGLWGYQEPGIGWIGTGVIYPAERYLFQDDSPEEHRAVISYYPGEWLRFHAQGDWLRAHRYGPGAGVKDWENTLQKKSSVLDLK